MNSHNHLLAFTCKVSSRLIQVHYPLEGVLHCCISLVKFTNPQKLFKIADNLKVSFLKTIFQMFRLTRDLKGLLGEYVMKNKNGKKDIMRLRMTCKSLLYNKNLKKAGRVKYYHKAGCRSQRKKDKRTARKIFMESGLPEFMMKLKNQPMPTHNGLVTYNATISFKLSSKKLVHFGVLRALKSNIKMFIFEVTSQILLVDIIEFKEKDVVQIIIHDLK